MLIKVSHIMMLKSPRDILIYSSSQMVHDLLELMYEDQGQPKQLNNEVGSLIILDRGKLREGRRWVGLCGWRFNF